MSAIRYYTDSCTYRLPHKRLTTAWLRAVARAEGYTAGDVNYIFCSAERLLSMNREFLGHDYFTDVITFDYSDLKGTCIVSGDVFIDVETVADNARKYGFTTLQEMRRVVVHGLLHLCGQGDKTPRTNAQMHRKEDRHLKFWDAAKHELPARWNAPSVQNFDPSTTDASISRSRKALRIPRQEQIAIPTSRNATQNEKL